MKDSMIALVLTNAKARMLVDYLRTQVEQARTHSSHGGPNKSLSNEMAVVSDVVDYLDGAITAPVVLTRL